MSWFTDIAGKAENLLNKIDQNAASVLKQNEKDESQETPLISSKISDNNSIMTTSTDSIISSSAKSNTTTIRKSLSLLNAVDYHKENMLNSGTNNKSQSASTSRRNSISSKSSKADGVVSNGSSNNTVSIPSFNKNTDETSNLNVELAATKIVLNEIKAERDELKLEIESLMEQVKDETSQSIIRELQTTTNQLIADKEILETKIDKLEKSNVNYVKSISDLESKLSKIHQIEQDLSGKLKWAQSEAEQAINELQQYRLRAQTTLQIKEQLIEQLKASKNGTTIIDDSNIDGQSVVSMSHHQLELEHLKNENLILNEENKQKNVQLEQIRQYVDKFEIMQREQQIDFDAKLLILNEKLKQDERKWMQYEAEYKAQTKELTTVRTEMTRVQMEMTGKLQQKESELQKLRSKLSQKPFDTIAINLEERIHSLTQSLVQKQNCLESMTADRNALQMQLLRQQRATRELPIIAPSQQIISVNDTDDAKARLPYFMQENPFDTRVARRMKRAYSTLDSVGVRFGVFLRRYPLIRILAIFYVAMLHLWVIFVLVTSTPSI